MINQVIEHRLLFAINNILNEHECETRIVIEKLPSYFALVITMQCLPSLEYYSIYLKLKLTEDINVF